MTSYPQFPDGFCIGTATAAYQIEGGWNEDGKGSPTWDVFAHRSGKIKNGDAGDVAGNTYHDIARTCGIATILDFSAIYQFINRSTES